MKLMNRKEKRVKIKDSARAQLAGGWLKGAVLIAVSILLGMFCTNFIPIYAPSQPVNVNQLASMNVAQMLELMADMLVPEQITRSYIARILISVTLFFMIIPPFEQGIKQYFCKVYSGEKPKLGAAFSWYTNLAKVFGSIRLYIYIGMLTVIWAVVILAVPVAAIVFSSVTALFGLYFIGMIAYIIGAVLLALKLMAYVPAYYIYAKKPSIGVLAAVRNSVYITRGRLVESLVFQLSFILWNIAVAFTGNFGKIFFRPYYLTASAGFVDMLIKDARAGESSEESVKF